MIQAVQKIILKELGEEVKEITRMKTGLCNEVYLAELPSRKIIIRMNKNPNEMKGSSKHLKRFRTLGINVQDILAEDYTKTEHPFAYQIRSYIEGKDIDHVITELSETELQSIAQEIAKIIKQLTKQPTNGKYGWVGGDDEKLFESWFELLKTGIQEIEERNKKTGAVGKKYVQIAKNLLEKYRHYFENVPSTFYYDDMSSKNVLVHEGKFAGLVDLDTMAYGDPLEGVGRIAASWYGTAHGTLYTEAVMNALNLNEKQREMVKVYALMNRIHWLSEAGIQFNQNTSTEINWNLVEKDQKIIDELSKELQ